MRRALWPGVLALLVAGTCWLSRDPRRLPVASPPIQVEEHADDGELELLQPELLENEAASSAPVADPPLSGGPRDGSRRTRVAPGRPAQGPPRSVVQGRLRVAETGDPIAESMSVRLRTLDLVQKEDLVTRLDGTFTSTQAYRAGALLALVRNGEGREVVDHEAYFDPSVPEEWPVLVPMRTYPALALGRVIDRRGAPLEEVRVQLVPTEPGSPYVEDLTDGLGGFELADLRAGTFRLHLQGLWTRSEPAELNLIAGANQLGDLVLTEPSAAELVVRFVTAEGDAFPDALLVLRPSSSIEMPFYDYLAEDVGGGRYELRLARVPAGECTLTVQSLDGRTYEPSRRAFSVPGEIEIRVSGAPREDLRLSVRDAESGAPLLAFDLWNRKYGFWSKSGISNIRHGSSRSDLGISGADAWVVMAKDHRTLRGTSDPRASGVVEVALERGWGELFVFEDVEGDSFGNYDVGRRRALLPGVEVIADGEFAGESDDDGLFALDRDGPPTTLEFRRPGWRVVRDALSGGVRLIGLAQSP